MSAVLNHRTRSAQGHCGDYLYHVDASPEWDGQTDSRGRRESASKPPGTGRPERPPESQTRQALDLTDGGTAGPSRRNASKSHHGTLNRKQRLAPMELVVTAHGPLPTAY